MTICCAQAHKGMWSREQGPVNPLVDQRVTVSRIAATDQAPRQTDVGQGPGQRSISPPEVCRHIWAGPLGAGGRTALERFVERVGRALDPAPPHMHTKNGCACVAGWALGSSGLGRSTMHRRQPARQPEDLFVQDRDLEKSSRTAVTAGTLTELTTTWLLPTETENQCNLTELMHANGTCNTVHWSWKIMEAACVARRTHRASSSSRRG